MKPGKPGPSPLAEKNIGKHSQLEGFSAGAWRIRYQMLQLTSSAQRRVFLMFLKTGSTCPNPGAFERLSFCVANLPLVQKPYRIDIGHRHRHCDIDTDIDSDYSEL